MYPALLGDHACSFLSSNRPKMLNKQRKESRQYKKISLLVFYSALGPIHFFLKKVG
jgi:hypothetical protein